MKKNVKRVGVVGAIGFAIFGTAAAAAIVLAGIGELRTTVANVNAYLISVGNNINFLTTTTGDTTTLVADLDTRVGDVEGDLETLTSAIDDIALDVAAIEGANIGDADAFIGYIFDNFGITADTALNGIEHLGNRLVDNIDDIADLVIALDVEKVRIDTLEASTALDTTAIATLRTNLQAQTERVNTLFNVINNHQRDITAAAAAALAAQTSAEAAQVTADAAQVTADEAKGTADTNTGDITDLKNGIEEVITILNGLDDGLPDIPVIQ